MAEKSDYMALWNRVCKTDPAFTKKVSQRGGFTSVCAQTQIKNATIEWGPYGMAWGVRDCEHDCIRDGKGEIVEVALKATFYYPGGDFPLSTDMAYKPGNDTRKKLLTDLTTKALSKLGFNSDVFEGLYDDNKYVQAMAKEFASPPAAAPPADPVAAALHTAKVTLLRSVMVLAKTDETGAAMLIGVTVKKLLGEKRETIDTIDELLKVKAAIVKPEKEA